MTLSVLENKATGPTDAGPSTVTITFVTTPTVGTGITIEFTSAVGESPVLDPTITDNQGVGVNTYQKAVAGNEVSGGQMAAIWYCGSLTAATGTFTITIAQHATSNNYSLVAAQRISGAITLDQVGTSTTTVAGVTTVTAAGALAIGDEIVIACYTEDSSDGSHTLGADGSYTNAMISTNTAAHIGASGDYKHVATTTAPTAVYTSTNTNFVDAVAVIATFKPAGAGPTITNVNTTNVVTSTSSGIIWAVTNAGASQGGSTVSFVQGSTTENQIVTSWADTSITTTTVFDSTIDLKYGAAVATLTLGGGGTATLAITITPPDARDWADLTSVNTTSSSRLTSSADLAIGDQIEVTSVTGAAISDVNLNADGTWDAVPLVTAFNFRVWSTADSTWGAVGIQTVNIDAPVWFQWKPKKGGGMDWLLNILEWF